ncbi:hypothetical protein MC885_000386 [Smutsia gigantea]|nr:hypothetical protein MC885_000386 [Smutsia gigantea]
MVAGAVVMVGLGGEGFSGIKFSAWYPHSLLCICAAQEAERAARVTLLQMTHLLELSLQPDQPPQVERKMLQYDSPPIHASLTVPEKDPGWALKMEGSAAQTPWKENQDQTP